MTLAPDEESVILAGRRLVGDAQGDDYFQYISAALRSSNGQNLFGIVRNAVHMFRAGRQSCAGCD